MYRLNSYLFLFSLVLTGLLLTAIPSHGQDFGWARQLGGTQKDVGYDVASDAAGNVYVTGYFNGTADFDPGAGVSTLTSNGGDVWCPWSTTPGAWSAS